MYLVNDLSPEIYEAATGKKPQESLSEYYSWCAMEYAKSAHNRTAGLIQEIEEIKRSIEVLSRQGK